VRKLEGPRGLFAQILPKLGEKDGMLPFLRTKSQIQCRRHRKRSAGWNFLLHVNI
jgi:hypothetical protein